MNSSLALLTLMRPKHWVKNLLIALPPVLAGKLNHPDALIQLALGMLSFSLMASSGYILNDIRDIDRDRAHPKKMLRPLAAAAVKPLHALLFALSLLGISVLISWQISKWAVFVLGVYFVLNYTYSTFLKALRFFDIVVLSSFYVIRLFYGSVLLDAELTGWFLATTTLAFLTLSTHKRFMECLVSKHEQLPGRDYVKADASLLQIFSATYAVGTLVLLNMHAFFVLQVKSPVFFALVNLCSAGITFAYFDHRKNHSDDPVERVLKNPLLLVMGALLIGVYIWEVMTHL
jgi:4-hydroxybenzoate polyprenyltransferase